MHTMLPPTLLSFTFSLLMLGKKTPVGRCDAVDTLRLIWSRRCSFEEEL